MHVFATELRSIGQILLVSLVFGVGLPALFSAGVRALAWGSGGDAEVAGPHGEAARAHPAGRVLAVVCFAVVVACIALALLYIVATGFGKELSFGHVYPTVVSKH